MNLIQMGWSHFFAQYFEQFSGKGLVPARIVRKNRLVYLVRTEDGELITEVSGKFRYITRSIGDFPSVGDWVVIQPRTEEGRATIHALFPRKTSFSRKVAGSKTEEQVVAANIDVIIIVSSLDRDFNLRRIERYLTLAWDSGANPIIALNKADLCHNVEEHISEVESVAYVVPIHTMSAKENQGLDILRQYLGVGRTAALLGSSGVGKSSIINCLLKSKRQHVNAVRENDSRGRHTTTCREMVFIPDGGMIIDNPGMREIQMWTDENKMQGAFEDINELARQCRFKDCKHKSEPGCAVHDALNKGLLDVARYENYLQLQKELRYLASRQDQKVRLAEKAKWKKISQWSKKMK